MVTEAPSGEPSGLTSEEARARLASNGPNRLVGHERAAWLKDLLSLFLDPMAVMLLVAAGLLLGERRDAIVMLAAQPLVQGSGPASGGCHPRGPAPSPLTLRSVAGLDVRAVWDVQKRV